jgi:hypothetical protein
MNIAHQDWIEMKEYITLVEAELGRRRISEREIAHLQKLMRQNTPRLRRKTNSQNRQTNI